MSDVMGDAGQVSDEYTPSTEEEEVFISSSFTSFHTEQPPSPGDWIPMTEDEAMERWSSWLRAHDAELIESLAKRIDFIIPATTTFHMDVAAQRGAREWLLAKAKEVRDGR